MLANVNITESTLSPRKCSRALNFDSLSSTESGPSSDEGLIRRVPKQKKKMVAPSSDTSSDGAHGLGALELRSKKMIKLPSLASFSKKVHAPPLIPRFNSTNSPRPLTGPSEFIALTIEPPRKKNDPDPDLPGTSQSFLEAQTLPSDATSASLSDPEFRDTLSTYVSNFCTSKELV